ncbi:hypothetical protein G6F62_001836 [Rhizopus arrhizus]|nr:hypothetical protein G6F62_001836 [Rhizopus arrhizus]
MEPKIPLDDRVPYLVQDATSIIRFLDTSPYRLYPGSVGQSVEVNLISLFSSSAVQEMGTGTDHAISTM